MFNTILYSYVDCLWLSQFLQSRMLYQCQFGILKIRSMILLITKYIYFFSGFCLWSVIIAYCYFLSFFYIDESIIISLIFSKIFLYLFFISLFDLFNYFLTYKYINIFIPSFIQINPHIIKDPFLISYSVLFTCPGNYQ